MKNEYPDYLRTVEQRYDIDPYPYRDPATEMSSIHVTATDYLGKINHYGFNGCRDLRKNCRFLVAGGGTGDAAIYLAEQLRGKDSHVTYIDISSASMKVAQERAKVRGLENIEWHHGSIMDLPSMGLEQFDYINCSGVLHHLENPQDALNALSTVLKNDGCMGLLLYARYGRASIYNIQSLARIINCGIEDVPAEVANVKTLLGNLEPEHWLFRDKERWAMELNAMGVGEMSDTGIYHLFLHEDHAFSLPQLYELVEKSNLFFTRLTGFPGHTRKYNPLLTIANPAFHQMIKRLPVRDQSSAGEIINGGILSHTIYVSKQDNTIANHNDAHCVPYLQYAFAAPAQLYSAMNNNPGVSLSIRMGSGNDMLVLNQGVYTKYLLRHMDGNHCLSEIFELAERDAVSDGLAGVSRAAIANDYAGLYDDFDSWEMIAVRDKSISHYKRVDELQAALIRG